MVSGVLGVDGGRAGWFYVRLGETVADFGVANRVQALLQLSPPADLILIDIAGWFGGRRPGTVV